MKITFDIEADNLLENATKIHCLVAKDYKTKKIFRFFDDGANIPRGEYDLYLDDIPRLFKATSVAIGHNIIRYDLRMLKKFFNISQSFDAIDTYIWSKTLYPDRPMPIGCPPVILNTKTGKNEKIGPHSLAAWGYRVGRGKPEYFDWEEFDEGMLNRCTEDVHINELVYEYELKEIE